MDIMEYRKYYAKQKIQILHDPKYFHHNCKFAEIVITI